MKRTPIQHAARAATYGLVLVVAAGLLLPWFVVSDRDEHVDRLESQVTSLGTSLTDEQVAHDESVAYWRGLYEASFSALTTDGSEGTLPTPDEADSDAPSSPVGTQGPAGPQGPGPSSSQIAAAVTAFCAGDACSSPPTVEDVSSAVAAYCANGRCVGAAGVNGANGAAGGNGSDGAPGRGPTTEEIAAAVASYCASGACTGPAGAPGVPGLNGADGRGIASLMCGDDGRWTVVYTDGSSSDAGQCRVIAAPEPPPTEPDPEPTDPPIIDLGL